MKNYEIYATVTIPVSVSVEAKTVKQAVEKAKNELSQETIIKSQLSVLRGDGQSINLTTHDFLINFDNVE